MARFGVDTSKWKPRQLRGTPAGRARDIVGILAISAGFIIATLYQCSSATKNFRKAVERLYEDPVEEVERKQMIALGYPTRTGDKIRKLIEESERPDTADK